MLPHAGIDDWTSAGAQSTRLVVSCALTQMVHNDFAFTASLFDFSSEVQQHETGPGGPFFGAKHVVSWPFSALLLATRWVRSSPMKEGVGNPRQNGTHPRHTHQSTPGTCIAMQLQQCSKIQEPTIVQRVLNNIRHRCRSPPFFCQKCWRKRCRELVRH